MDEIRVSLAGDYVSGILQVVNNEGFFSVMDAEMTNNTTGQSVSHTASAQEYSRYNSVVPKRRQTPKRGTNTNGVLMNKLSEDRGVF